MHNFDETIAKLSNISQSELHHYGIEGVPFPSVPELKEVVEICRSLLFPGYYGKSIVDGSLLYHMGVGVERLYEKLAKQIEAGLTFVQAENEDRKSLHEHARQCAQTFVDRLPELRNTLATDVVAMYRNDPAAHNLGEVILCYPGMRAITNYRIAHLLEVLQVPLIPRMITELAHSETGIDIHPGATIGESFAIDHGTGVVIGATAILGHHVTLYQGVTLGAKNFPQEEDGSLVKGIERHPILGNHVVVYANATILGRINIGDNAVIGGNLWITRNVPADTKIFYKQDPQHLVYVASTFDDYQI
ncbi:MAG: serine acetyltransferase [Bacteroidales bacterium]|nr:serine acetyltransferase [Bacteroidales bacterium]